MVDGDGFIEARLTDEYGRDWFIGRTYRDGAPHWWRAKRMRHLSDAELDRGLEMTLIYDTAALLREALIAQADLEVRVAAAQALSTGPACNPACL